MRPNVRRIRTRTIEIQKTSAMATGLPFDLNGTTARRQCGVKKRAPGLNKPSRDRNAEGWEELRGYCCGVCPVAFM
jgi:hypothetical protein